MSTKLFKEFLLLRYMGLIEVLVGKRDKREEEINDLLEKVLKEWPKKNHKGKTYLTQATDKKAEIEKERGTIYFDKYPEIPNKIKAIINKLMGYES